MKSRQGKKLKLQECCLIEFTTVKKNFLKIQFEKILKYIKKDNSSAKKNKNMFQYYVESKKMISFENESIIKKQIIKKTGNHNQAEWLTNE